MKPDTQERPDFEKAAEPEKPDFEDRATNYFQDEPGCKAGIQLQKDIWTEFVDPLVRDVNNWKFILEEVRKENERKGLALYEARKRIEELEAEVAMLKVKPKRPKRIKSSMYDYKAPGFNDHHNK